MKLSELNEATTIVADYRQGLVTFCDRDMAEQILESYPRAQRGIDFFFMGGNCDIFRDLFADFVLCYPRQMMRGSNQ
jgi:hypothetical protein